MTSEEFEQACQEFKAIYKEEFGVELSDKEVATRAQGLLQLFECLTKGMENGVR